MARRIHALMAAAPSAWLREHGGLPESIPSETLQSPDGVPIAVQRELLEEVARRGGPHVLLELPRAITRTTDEPLLFVMLNSRSVEDFVDKEQRFNHFFHSDHRVRVLERGERHIVLCHRGELDRPVRVESLFVLGIHLAMFDQLGCEGVTACLPRSEQPSRWLALPDKQEPPLGDASEWHIRWERFQPRREPMPGLDELLLAQSAPANLSGDDTTSGRVQRVVLQDLAHRWTLGEVAAALHTSSRSLQRELNACGESFVQLLDRVRVDAAARLLRDSGRSLTEIGYVCGFSDSAHFSRRFKARMGRAPAAWRRAPG